MNHRIFENPKLLKIWSWCLLRARHEQGDFYFGRKKIFLKPGEFIFGRKRAAEELDMAPTTVWDYMKLLESDNSIDIKSTARFSIISITNWSYYQSTPTESPTTNGGEKDTNKNEMNKNTSAPNAKKQSELKKPSCNIAFNFETQQWENITCTDKDGWNKAFPACDVETELHAMKQWLLSNPSKRKKNYRRFVTNWLGRQQDKGGTHKGKVKQDPYDLTTMEMKNK